MSPRVHAGKQQAAKHPGEMTEAMSKVFRGL